MDIAWFCRVGERQVGPISFDQLRRMAARGDLKLTTLIRRADINTWIEAGQIPELWPRAEALPAEPAAPGRPGPVGPAGAVPRATPSAGPGTAPGQPAVAVPQTPQIVPVFPVPRAGAPHGAVPHGAPPLPAGQAAVKPLPVGPAPAGPIPAGPVPVGPMQVGPIPVGPMSAGPVPVGPIPVGPIPVGPIPVGARPAGAPNERQAKAEQRRREARKKLYLLLGGTGSLLAILVVVGVVMSAGGKRGSDGGATVAANSAASPVATDSVAVGGGEPAGRLAATAGNTAGVASGTGASLPAAAPAAAPAPKGPTTRPAAPAGNSRTTGVAAGAKPKVIDDAAARSASAVDQILRTTQPWRNLSSVNSVSSRQSRVQITGVWFAPLKSATANAGGTAAVPASGQASGAAAPPAVDVVAELLKGSQAATPKTDPAVAGGDAGPASGTPPLDATAPTPTPTPAPATAKTAGPRVVCVEVRVTNPEQSGTPLNYLSWNQTPAKATSPVVILVDSAKHPLSLVPKTKFSDPLRRDAPLRLAPGQGVTDLLVFEAPADEFDHLRLALRLSAMGQGDRYLGFEVPREMVADSRPEELVDSAPNRSKGGVAGATARTSAGERPASEPTAESAAMPPPGPPMPREETILDLKKQIEDAAKKTKAEKAMELKKRDEEERRKNASESPDAASEPDESSPAPEARQSGGSPKPNTVDAETDKT